MVKRLVLVAYFLEVGLLLVLVPWTPFWERNYFATSAPQFHDLIRNNFVRGAVSGLGGVNLVVAFSELFALLTLRRGLEPLPRNGTAPIPNLLNED